MNLLGADKDKLLLFSALLMLILLLFVIVCYVLVGLGVAVDCGGVLGECGGVLGDCGGDDIFAGVFMLLVLLLMLLSILFDVAYVNILPRNRSRQDLFILEAQLKTLARLTYARKKHHTSNASMKTVQCL